MRKILILSVSAGAGHVRAAEALREAAELRFQGRVSAIHVDVMEMVPSFFKDLYCGTYTFMVARHPELWGYLYNKTDRWPDSGSTLDKMRKAVEGVNTRKLRKLVERFEPDAVVCTHFLPAELLSRMLAKKKVSCPCWVVVTDFDIHSLWVHEGMAGYFVPSEEVGWRLREKGVPPGRTRVAGIPVSPAFAARPSKEACLRQLGLDAGSPTLLLMSGGHGVLAIDKIAERLLAKGVDVQLLAVAGRNERLRKSLSSLAASAPPGRLTPFGFTNAIPVLMGASDAIVTKPGGLTTAECLACGLPMVVVSPIPGQEERNADFLLENGAALKACDLAGLELKLRRLLGEPAALARMARAAAALGRPRAAEDILEAILA